MCKRLHNLFVLALDFIVLAILRHAGRAKISGRLEELDPVQNLRTGIVFFSCKKCSVILRGHP